MELQFNEAERRFQTEVRDFIAANLPNDLREKMLAGNSVGKEGILRWHGILARRGWGAPAHRTCRVSGSTWSVR